MAADSPCVIHILKDIGKSPSSMLSMWIREASGELNMIEASFRWLAHHSMLDAEMGDAIIIGASNLKQLQQKLTFNKGPCQRKYRGV